MNANNVRVYSPILSSDNLEHLIWYAKYKNRLKEAIQINLDNCTIQRMERLDKNSTVEDIKKLGLYPLYKILTECPNILISALGINEMPGCYISRAREAYNLFCKKFIPSYVDDPNATNKPFNVEEEKIIFRDLPLDTQKALGCFYLPYLLIQYIYKYNSGQSGLDKFRHYLYGVIHYLDMVSAFELELAKYAFWEINDKSVIHTLSSEIKERRKRIRKNFVKERNSLNSIRAACLNSAMDTYWIRSICIGTDEREAILNGYTICEHWLATNDDKLYIIANDIKPVQSINGFGYIIESVREKELLEFSYWKEVDNLSSKVLNDRKYLSDSQFDIKIENITESISQLDDALEKYFRNLTVRSQPD